MQAVRNRIDAAARSAGRPPGSIRLIAVSKTFGVEAIGEAYVAGQTAFGESYLQEALAKIQAFSDPFSPSGSLLRPLEWHVAHGHQDGGQRDGDERPSAGVASPQAGPLLRPLEWHFIGPIQSNKTRLIAEHFHWVHGVDRLRIAERLSLSRPPGLPPLELCLQVNISGEASKSGVGPDEVLALARAVSPLAGIRLRGLMAIPEPTEDTSLQRSRFRQIRELKDEIVSSGIALDTLSMGMSDDLEAAIAEGATLVRVGRAIFGERSPDPA
jgi:pyridoxal phosphate enzyme (YggS family)